jgi:hypothetical protein
MAKETTLQERGLSVGSLQMDSLDLTLQDLRSDFARKQREVVEWKTSSLVLSRDFPWDGITV